MESDQLQQLRKRLVLTQQQMADALGVSLVTYNRWENSVRDIPDEVQRLLECLRELIEKPSAHKMKYSLSEIKDAIKGGGVMGVIAGAVIGGMISESVILRTAAIPAFAWLSGIAGLGVLGSMPFFKKLISTKKGGERKNEVS